MSILADTNVLLRGVQSGHPSHLAAVESIARLLAAGETIYYTLQNIAEFWNVATRPTVNNGMGLSATQTLLEVERIERALTFLSELPAAYAEWKRLVTTHNVLGAKVHDARLVAAMNVHFVRTILTFNTSDFTRYNVEAIHPEAAIA